MQGVSQGEDTARLEPDGRNTRRRVQTQRFATYPLSVPPLRATAATDVDESFLRFPLSFLIFEPSPLLVLLSRASSEATNQDRI